MQVKECPAGPEMISERRPAVCEPHPTVRRFRSRVGVINSSLSMREDDCFRFVGVARAGESPTTVVAGDGAGEGKPYSENDFRSLVNST